jgi:uncharacterized caspase-like protein
MRLAKLIVAALSIVVVLPGFAVPAAAEKRVALIIGNGAYEHADALSNPVIDARSMRTVLTKIGFDDTNIVYGENLVKRDFERALAHFATSARDADVAVVFYAGHGANFGGIPYAVPVRRAIHKPRTHGLRTRDARCDGRRAAPRQGHRYCYFRCLP